MDSPREKLTRHYRQAILEHMNEHPEQFVAGGDDTPAAPIRKLRQTVPGAVGRGPAPWQYVPQEPGPSGVELQWHDVIGPTYHTLLRITPTNQELYAQDPRFQNFDEQKRRYATLGAGPDPMSVYGMFLGGKLKSDYNRELDIAPHERGIPLQPPGGMSEDAFINRLFKIDREYPDDLDYSVSTHGPYMGHGRAPIQVPGAYDSNSYVSGLLQAAGVAPPELPVWAPGYETRLSPRHFGR